MNPLPISLAVFDNSKGHFSRTDIYKTTITDLASKIPLELFKNLVCHIKVAPGEEAVFSKQQQFYKSLGFDVLHSVESWKHFSPEHQKGYSRDIIKVFEQEKLLLTPYVLWLESDWLFSPNSGKTLADYIGQAMAYLEKNPRVLSVRFPRFCDEPDRLSKLKQKHNLDVTVQREIEPWSKFWRHNDSFSCNPNICRSRDLYAATRILKMNFDTYSQHIEMGFTKCLAWLADGQLPYSIFDPGEVNVAHIGTRHGEEDPVGVSIYAN